MGLLLEDGSTEVLLGLALLLLVVYHHVTAQFDYWACRGVPYLKPEPFFGNIRDFVLMRKSYAEVFGRLYNDSDPHPVVGFFFQARPALLVRDPEMVKLVLIKDFAHFPSRYQVSDARTTPMALNLFHVGSRTWRPLRTKLSPTFTSGRIKAMFPLLAECAAQLQASTDAALADAHGAGAVLEMRDALAKFSTDVIGTCAFGLQCNALQDPDSTFREIGRKMFKPRKSTMALRFLYGGVPFLQRFKGKFTGDAVSDFFLELVRQTVDERLEKDIKRNDFLDLLIQLKQKGHLEGDAHALVQTEESIEFTHELMTAQCFVFFAAGFETSSTTMSFCLHELAVHQDVQERVRAEVDAVVRKHGGAITYDAIQDMTYLDQVVAETLRMYPPLPFLDRVCEVPYKLPGSGAVIEPGTRVFIPVCGLHSDPRYFPQPDKFDPERFSEQNKASINRNAYLPFGEGPRNCIGMRFGQLQTKVGLASMLQKFRFETCDQTAVPPRLAPLSFVMAPVGGVFLRVTRRREAAPA
ncbi:cytochrome P450 6a2-like [Schistocerca cancellata]|uniref:cytochrome P450 6a2-like n=1 Tax=Schistocerca cancellata TaxID=274614 RepID=UPI0021194D10|nr:cytochrome P450 6a2-like [Schistocerca cancellata]